MDYTSLYTLQGLELACWPRIRSCTGAWILEELGVYAVCTRGRGGLPRGCLGKGHSSLVLAVLAWGVGEAAAKIIRPGGRRESLESEARLLYEAWRAGAAPRVYRWTPRGILMELLRGPSLGFLVEECMLTEDKIAEAMEAAYALDTAGILHYEIHRPWRNIFYRDSRAVIIDFESAGPGCGNVPRLAQALLSRIPGGLGIVKSHGRVLGLYKKRCPDRELMEEITGVVVSAFREGDCPSRRVQHL